MRSECINKKKILNYAINNRNENLKEITEECGLKINVAKETLHEL